MTDSILSSSVAVRLVQDWTQGMKPTSQDDRLVRIGFRLTSAAKARGETEKKPKAVSVPKMDWTGYYGQFSDYLNACLDKLQEDTIRAKIEAGATTLSSNDYGARAMQDFLAEQASGGRLSKEMVGEWFNEELAPMALPIIVSKLGWNLDTLTENQGQKVQKVIAGLRDMVTALAGSKTHYTPEQAVKLRVYVAMPEDAMSVRLVARLDAMLKKEEEEDIMDAL